MPVLTEYERGYDDAMNDIQISIEFGKEELRRLRRARFEKIEQRKTARK